MAEKPVIFKAARAFLTAIIQGLALPRALFFLLTTLPYLFLARSLAVRPPTVLTFDPRSTKDLLILPLAILLTFMAFFIAFMAAFMAFIAFIAFIGFFIAFIGAFIAFIGAASAPFFFAAFIAFIAAFSIATFIAFIGAASAPFFIAAFIAFIAAFFIAAFIAFIGAASAPVFFVGKSLTGNSGGESKSMRAGIALDSCEHALHPSHMQQYSSDSGRSLSKF